MTDTLFDTEPLYKPKARARRRDSWTSHAAAASQSSEQMTETQSRVLALIRMHGPATQERILEKYRQAYGDDVADSRVRTAVSELHEEHPVKPSKEPGESKRGRPAQRWEVA